MSIDTLDQLRQDKAAAELTELAAVADMTRAHQRQRAARKDVAQLTKRIQRAEELERERIARNWQPKPRSLV